MFFEVKNIPMQVRASEADGRLDSKKVVNREASTLHSQHSSFYIYVSRKNLGKTEKTSAYMACAGLRGISLPSTFLVDHSIDYPKTR